MILSESRGRLCNPADTKIEIVDYWNYTLFMQGNEIMQVRWGAFQNWGVVRRTPRR